MRNDKHCAGYVDDGSIHLPLIIIKNAQTQQFSCERTGFGSVVGRVDADENAKAAVDRADDAARHGDVGFGNSLDKKTHD